MRIDLHTQVSKPVTFEVDRLVGGVSDIDKGTPGDESRREVVDNGANQLAVFSGTEVDLRDSLLAGIGFPAPKCITYRATTRWVGSRWR